MNYIQKYNAQRVVTLEGNFEGIAKSHNPREFVKENFQNVSRDLGEYTLRKDLPFSENFMKLNSIVSSFSH